MNTTDKPQHVIQFDTIDELNAYVLKQARTDDLIELMTLYPPDKELAVIERYCQKWGIHPVRLPMGRNAIDGPVTRQKIFKFLRGHE